jgi:hypothetical protein
MNTNEDDGTDENVQLTNEILAQSMRSKQSIHRLNTHQIQAIEEEQLTSLRLPESQRRLNMNLRMQHNTSNPITAKE